MKKIVFLMLIMAFLCCGCEKEEMDVKDYSVSGEEVLSMIEEDNTYVIDVREVDEYNYGHIKAAINIPLNTISEALLEEIPIDSRVIVYCQSGNRSKMAITKLIDLGYKNVFDLGSINNWTDDIVID